MRIPLWIRKIYGALKNIRSSEKYTVCSLLSDKSVLLTHCPQICIRKEISRPYFLDVSRQDFRNPIDLRRVFLHYVNISMCKFDDSVSCPGLYGGLYGQNLPYKFKNSYGDLQNCNFEKSHRTTGPRSDLRPDSWSWANSILDTSIRPSISSKPKVFGWRPGRIKQRHST